jgi:hypothetical protein
MPDDPKEGGGEKRKKQKELHMSGTKQTSSILGAVDTIGSLVIILSGMAGMAYILFAGFGVGSVVA